LNDTGADVPADGETIGRLHVRGPMLFDGYLNRADATAGVFDADGWYQFNGVAFGQYSIRVSKAGFTLYDSGEFQVSSDLNLDAELKAEENGSPSRARRR
jgi:acyl-CoA synthetase (AMP-forming)/AMP-acid ligase II